MNLGSLIQAVTRSAMTFYREEDGQDLIEYSLLIAFVTLATVGLMADVRMEARGIISTMTVALTSATGAAS